MELILPARSASKTSCRVRTAIRHTAPAYLSFFAFTGNAAAVISSLALRWGASGDVSPGRRHHGEVVRPPPARRRSRRRACQLRLLACPPDRALARGRAVHADGDHRNIGYCGSVRSVWSVVGSTRVGLRRCHTRKNPPSSTIPIPSIRLMLIPLALRKSESEVKSPAAVSITPYTVNSPPMSSRISKSLDAADCGVSAEVDVASETGSTMAGIP